MLLQELWVIRDDYIREYLTNGEILTAECFKDAVKKAEERLAAEYPYQWSFWVSIKDYPLLPSSATRAMRRLGIKTGRRSANVQNVLDVFWRYKLTKDKSEREQKRFTLEEVMLHRQCFILDALRINPASVL